MAEFTETVTITVTCPACKGGQVKKVGKQNDQQRFRCRDCKKIFRNNGKVEGKMFGDEDVGIAVRHYYSGLSYKQIAEGMEDYLDVSEPGKATIYEWVVENTDKATQIMKDYLAHTGDHWVADEIMVRVGGEWCYHWNVMDYDTRYLLASHLSKRRTAREAMKVMQKALAAAHKPPSEITTDGYPGYPAAIRAVFPRAKHIISEGIRAPINNNRSERLQGTIRDRDITLRGMDCIETGQRFLDGWQVHYNLFREHEGVGSKTPGEAAKVESPLKEWADVVRADVEVPKHKPVPRVRKDAPAKDWVTKKRRQRRRRKAEKVNKANGVPKEQLWLLPKDKPLPIERPQADTVSVHKPAEMRVKAPQAVMPDMQLRSKPKPRPHHFQREMFEQQWRPVPARMRPKPAGRTRR